QTPTELTSSTRLPSISSLVSSLTIDRVMVKQAVKEFDKNRIPLRINPIKCPSEKKNSKINKELKILYGRFKTLKIILFSKPCMLSSPSRFAYSINSRPNLSSRLRRHLGLPSHMHTIRDES
ncbi:hypothetical protein BpHYR1_005021, partial [Brachionus plicatilis]